MKMEDVAQTKTEKIESTDLDKVNQDQSEVIGDINLPLPRRESAVSAIISSLFGGDSDAKVYAISPSTNPNLARLQRRSPRHPKVMGVHSTSEAQGHHRS